MKYNEWKLFTESLQGNMTLGLSHPKTIGGPIGSNYSEFAFNDDEDDDDDEEDDDEEYDGQQTDDDEGLDGDLVGSSSEDEGPDKNWPPDNSEEQDGLPTPDEEMLGGNEFGGDDFGGDDLASAMGGSEFGDEFGGEGGDLGSALAGGMGDMEQAPEGEPDMSFLDDLPQDLLGQEDEFGGEAGAGMEEPCPDCNPHGDQEEGDPDCPTCQGLGFMEPEGEFGQDGSEFDFGGEDDLEGLDDLDGVGAAPAPDKEMLGYMNRMGAYMQKYMRREWNDLHETGMMMQQPQPGTVPPQMQQQQQMQQQRPPMPPPAPQPNNGAQMTPQQQMMRKKMVKFMTKGGKERSFMAADAPRKRKSKRNHCPCESTNDFLNSLCKNASRQQRGRSGISEEALFALADPNAEYAQGEQQAGISAGHVGFAPQGRVGSIGGGYTQKDIQDIPVQESYSYPTLAEYAARKARRSKKRK